MSKANQDTNAQLGRLQPQAVDMEEVVLGALMLEKSAIDEVADILKVEVFYNEPHGFIYGAILTLWQTHQPIDILTVTAELRRQGKLEMVGGAYYVTTLTNRVASGANIKAHANAIYEKYVLRELISLSHRMGSKAFREEADVKEIIEEIENGLSALYGNIVGSNVSGEIKPTLNEIRQSFDSIEEQELTGLHTGNNRLNAITGGFQDNDLIILAARPSAGKTARALKVAISAWQQQGKKGCFFSLEMSKKQVLERLVSEAGRFNGELFRAKKKANEQDIEQLMKGIGTVYEYGIEIYDKPAININFIRSLSKKFKKTHGRLDYVIVDYLQLMTVPADKKSKNREQEVAEISRSLKAFAKEFEIPVIALAQLSRDLEKRSDKRPIMSDLRESGGIEQDADLIIFLYQPCKYYDFSSDPDYKDGQEYSVNEMNHHRLIEVLIGKHRNGVTGDTILEEFIGEHMAYKDWLDTYNPQSTQFPHPFGGINYPQPEDKAPW